MPSLLAPIAAFVAVLALIPLALWLLKRTPLGTKAASATMRVVATLPLAPNQRIVTVEVGTGDDRRWLVLGVAPGGIHTLHSMPPQAADAAAPAAFAQIIAGQRAGATDAR